MEISPLLLSIFNVLPVCEMNAAVPKGGRHPRPRKMNLATNTVLKYHLLISTTAGHPVGLIS